MSLENNYFWKYNRLYKWVSKLNRPPPSPNKTEAALTPMQHTSLVTEPFVISILPIEILHIKPCGTAWYGSLLCDTFRSSPQDDGQGERDKEVALTQIRVF